MAMKYRRLGETSLLVSELSFGSWVTFQDGENAVDKALALCKRMYDRGCNFFDGAEAYAAGDAEVILGEALTRGMQQGLWDRSDLVLSTKIFFGDLAPNKKWGGSKKYVAGRKTVNKIGLSRKHIVEGVAAAKQRLQVDSIDLVFCHRFDPAANLEEVVRAFNELIARGDIYYWGTSEWTAAQLEKARGIADRLGLVGPAFDQPEYNLFNRDKVEVEFAQLYPNLGLTTWSPLASGVLTGKYAGGVPKGSRLDLPEFKHRPDYTEFMAKIQLAEKLRPIADQLGCSMAQLALCWTLKNPNVSTVITGATSLQQVDDNLGALDVFDKLTPAIMKEIDAAFGNKPSPPRPMQQVQYRMRPIRSKF